MCEQLGEEPNPDKMPLEASDFPEEVQAAFFVYNLLPDRWDGMSGMYLGKDWAALGYIMSLYDIDCPKEVTMFIKVYENIVIKKLTQDRERQRKAEERKQKASGGGGKNYTHNVQG